MEPTNETPDAAPLPESRRWSRLPSLVVAGGAALGMTLAGLGIANAQTEPETPSTTGDVVAPAPAPSRGPGGVGCHGGAAKLDTAAEAIGITDAELRTGLESGKSLADLAQAEDVDPQKVIDALVAEAKAGLAERVAAGDVTQAEADERSAELTERITAMVNGEVKLAPRIGRFERREAAVEATSV